MARWVWWGTGLGVCAASIRFVIADNSQYEIVSLIILCTFLAARGIALVEGIQDRMDGIAAILLEEEEEGQLFHPPYDIELPEDEA